MNENLSPTEQIVFLVDVDNTLIDNDRFGLELRAETPTILQFLFGHDFLRGYYPLRQLSNFPGPLQARAFTQGRSAGASQPWALRQNPFGIRRKELPKGFC